MRAVLAIAWVTYRELIRDKILYNIIVVGALLVGLSLLVSQLSFVKQDRILMHLGIGSTGITLALLSILAAGSLLPRELERRTMWVALAHPIRKAHFVLGKWVGFWGFLVTNFALLVALLLALLHFAKAADDPPLSSAFWFALVLTLAQAWVLSALSSFFSSFSTVGMSAGFTLGLYLAGNNVTELHWLSQKIQSPALRAIVTGLAGMIPNLESFHVGTQAAYRLPLSNSYLLSALLTSTAWVGLLGFATVLLMQSKEG